MNHAVRRSHDYFITRTLNVEEDSEDEKLFEDEFDKRERENEFRDEEDRENEERDIRDGWYAEQYLFDSGYHS